MEREPNSSFQFPPGFRFHPTDEELIVHYLKNKVMSCPLPASIIAEIDLYKYNPWELPPKAVFGEDEWYFFSPRDRKYPNGVRPNRAAGLGYWKATGTDRPILTSSGARSIGVKKALVFYIGKPPKGAKTDWIMNEYRLLDTMIQPSRLKGSMRLDDWVLCRVRQRGNMIKKTCEVQDSPSTDLASYLPRIEESRPTYTKWNTSMFNDPLYKDCRLIDSILTGQDLPPIKNISNLSFQGSNKGNSCSSVYEDSSDKVNSPITVSSFDNFLYPLKRKPSEDNGCDNLLPSKKQLTNNNNKNEDLPSKTLGNNDMDFYNQNQSQYDFFNPNPLNPIINLQELTDELAFTEILTVMKD